MLQAAASRRAPAPQPLQEQAADRRAHSLWHQFVCREIVDRQNPESLGELWNRFSLLTEAEQHALSNEPLPRRRRRSRNRRSRPPPLHSDDTPWGVGGGGFPIRGDLLEETSKRIGAQALEWRAMVSEGIDGKDIRSRRRGRQATSRTLLQAIWARGLRARLERGRVGENRRLQGEPQEVGARRRLRRAAEGFARHTKLALVPRVIGSELGGLDASPWVGRASSPTVRVHAPGDAVTEAVHRRALDMHIGGRLSAGTWHNGEGQP